ncbi:MAG: ROK family protein [Gemmatimonadaceae bacterium]
MPVAGIDLGGTKLAAAAFSDDGEILHRESVPLAGREGDAVGSLIAERLKILSEEFHCHAAGVCVPGLYRSARGTVWAPNIPGWDDYPLRDELIDAFGAGHPVTIDSDRAAYILGETWRGVARGKRDAIFLAVGTGIGAGILSGGKIIRGHGDVAGAIGWLALDRAFKPRYKDHGCFEDAASGPGLVRIARDFLDTSYTNAGDVFAAYDRDDEIGVKVIDNAIELWGMAAANLVSLFNPEVIVFGGGVFGPAVKFLDRIYSEAKRWAQPIAIEQVRFVASELGSDAGLFGAGRLAMLAEHET